jgi:IS5 family transposase
MSFASLAFANKKKTTRREQFLVEMERVVPWAQLCALVEPHYPKGERGRPVMPLERMLRIYFMQQWFNLSDPTMEEALYDSASMRSFAGLDLADDGAPDETTILNFRHLLERHRLTEAMFAEVGALLAERGLMLRRGTIVDATIIEAPTSTKNAEQSRDPEMSQTKKRNTWHFGMKVHVGAQAHGLPLVHSVAVGTGAENELGRLGELLHGAERELFGDRGYWSKEDRRLCTQAGIAYRVQQRSRATQPLTERQRQRNRRLASIRAPVEHPFHVIKRLWGFAKVRYRGLYKNAVRVYALFALANLYLARRRLLAHRG